jgi:hypothetical protein
VQPDILPSALLFQIHEERSEEEDRYGPAHNLDPFRTMVLAVLRFRGKTGSRCPKEKKKTRKIVRNRQMAKFMFLLLLADISHCCQIGKRGRSSDVRTTKRRFAKYQMYGLHASISRE